MRNSLLTGIALLLLLSTPAKAQPGMPVQDKANNGQLKRMVYIQWNDWQPTPDVNWLGLPKNIAGFIYWRILHHGYWRGEDSRPMKTGGPFMQNYAALIAQENDDARITDATNSIMQTNTATYLNMSGGVLDLPYNLFFKDKFNTIFDDIAGQLTIVQQQYPAVFNEMVVTENFQEFLEYLDITQDQVAHIHESFLDKGKRITRYLQILNELEYKRKMITRYISQYVILSKLPKQSEINAAGNQATPPNGDAEIVRRILQTHHF